MVDRQFCSLLLCGFFTSRGTLRNGQNFWIFPTAQLGRGLCGLARLLEALGPTRSRVDQSPAPQPIVAQQDTIVVVSHTRQQYAHNFYVSNGGK
jgi:hypothetical protein